MTNEPWMVIEVDGVHFDVQYEIEPAEPDVGLSSPVVIINKIIVDEGNKNADLCDLMINGPNTIEEIERHVLTRLTNRKKRAAH